MKNRLFLLATLLFAALSVCAQNTFLWKIEKPGNPNISYLLGTNPLLTTHFLDTYPVLKEKLSKSSIVVFEADETAIKAAQNKVAAIPDNEELKNILTDEQKKKVLKYLGFKGMKQTPLQLVDMINDFNSKSEHASAKGENLHLFLKNNATADKKKIVYLETASKLLESGQQERKAPGIANLLARKSLGKLVDDLGTAPVSKEPLEPVRKYYSLDLDYYLKADVPHNYQRDLVEVQNNRWMKQIPQILNSSSAFISLETMHLQYRFGLISQLMSLGYKVTPLDMKTGAELPYQK